MSISKTCCVYAGQRERKSVKLHAMENYKVAKKILLCDNYMQMSL